MKIMNYIMTLVLATVGLVFLTSAGVAVDASASAPPVEKTEMSKKDQKKAERKQARLNRLKARYERATTAKAKTRIQTKINNVEQMQEPSTLAIVAFIFAFLFPLVGLILAIIARKNDDGGLAKAAFWISLIFLILAVVGIILSIVLFAAAVGSVGGI